MKKKRPHEVQHKCFESFGILTVGSLPAIWHSSILLAEAGQNNCWKRRKQFKLATEPTSNRYRDKQHGETHHVQKQITGKMCENEYKG